MMAEGAPRGETYWSRKLRPRGMASMGSMRREAKALKPDLVTPTSAFRHERDLSRRPCLRFFIDHGDERVHGG